MARGYLVGGGGGGASSDELSANAEDVLSQKTYIGADTDDEIGFGEMTDRQNTEVKAASIESDGTNIKFNIPERACYNTGSKVTTLLSDLGDAGTNFVLKDKTFTSSAGYRATGSIPSKDAGTYTASTSDQKVDAGQYLNGDQIFKGVSLSGNTNNILKNDPVIIYSNNQEVTRITGAMPNQTGWSGKIGVNDSVKIPRGYHDGNYSVYNETPTYGGAAKVLKSNDTRFELGSGYYLTGAINISVNVYNGSIS